MLKHQSELNALQETLRQVELYNQEMQAEIQITRRATYKAEQSMQELEQNKLRQDLYIDTLTANLNKLKEQIGYYSKQVRLFFQLILILSTACELNAVVCLMLVASDRLLRRSKKLLMRSKC